MTHETIPFDPDFDATERQGAGTPSGVAFAFGFVAAIAVAAVLALIILL